MPSYKLVFDARFRPEVFTVDCSYPDDAVRAYAKFLSEKIGVAVTVYPEVPVMFVAKPPVLEKKNGASQDPARPILSCTKIQDESTLFVDNVPKHAKFLTPDSGWISHVTWEKFNRSIGVHFKRGGYIIYKSTYQTFDAFKLWVENGGSAGEYMNKNIKGLPVIKSKTPN